MNKNRRYATPHSEVLVIFIHHQKSQKSTWLYIDSLGRLERHEQWNTTRLTRRSELSSRYTCRSCCLCLG